MNADRNQPEAPSAAELAAYLDDELPAELAWRVELWLGGNPELAAELEAHRDLTHTFQCVSLPDPAPEQWDRTLRRIESALSDRSTRLSTAAQARQTPVRLRRRSRWLRWTAAAAAVFFFAFLNMQNPELRQNATLNPLPVVGADEVDILSVHGRDIGTLVVGTLPLHEPLALATIHDVTVENMQPDLDGMMPDASPTTSTSPMIVAPLNGTSPAERAP